MTTAQLLPPPATPHADSPSRKRALRIVEWSLVGIALAGVAAGIVRWRTARPAPTVRYETAAVDRGPLAAKVTATGVVSALVTVQVGSQVSGRIERLDADFKSQVRRGQTIATLEPSLFRAAVAQARANVVSARASVERARARSAQAEKDFARAKALHAEGLATRAEYDAAEATLASTHADEIAAKATVAQASAALDQAELNLRYTTVTSPIDGVVISRNVDVGQTVAATLQAPTLFTIAQDLTRMQVDTNVAEADIGKIHAGMKVSFKVDAFPARGFDGVVRQVRDNATTIQNVVTYDAVIDVENTDRLLKPGMTANVVFTHATREDALRMPNGALRFKPDAATLAAMGAALPSTPTRPDERVVWLLRGEGASATTITIGITDGTATEVLAGELSSGDRVVVEANATGAAAAKRGP